MEAVTYLWQRIEQWLGTHAPQLLDQLHPGASEEELVQVEDALGVTLPEDFKASYRLHNGGAKLFMGMSEPFFSLERVVSEWSVYQDLKEHESGWAEEEPGFLSRSTHPPIQPVWWHSKLIPFAANGAGDNWCVDLDPTPGGHVGQVIDWDHEDGPTTVLFESFEALLAQLADDLEAGKYLSFGFRLEERLTQGKEARDQAKRFDCEQPSPAKELLDKAYLSGPGTFDQKLALYSQVLQMERASLVDRFRAYHSLFFLHRHLGHRVEAEQLLAAFQAEARQMPADHWVHDDLKQESHEVSLARQLLDHARRAVGERTIGSELFVLPLTLDQNKQWFTAEERFDLFVLLIELLLQQQRPEQAERTLAQFAAEAQKRPPADPVHERVGYWTAQLQQARGEQT